SLAARRYQTGRGPIEDDHRPRDLDATDGGARDAYRQVGKAIAVEISAGERATEVGVLLERARNARAVLRPQLSAGRGHACRRTVENVHRSCVRDTTDALSHHAYRQVRKAVTVEVRSEGCR